MECQRSKVLTRNLNTVQIPNIRGSICSRSVERLLHTLTNSSIAISHIRGIRSSTNRNINRSGHLASTGCHFHRIRMSGSGGRNKHGSRGIGRRNTRPRVGDILIVKSRSGGGQRNRFASANIHLVSSQSNRATKLIDRKVNLSLAIGGVVLHRQRIDTRLVGILRGIITSSGSTSRNRPRIGVIAGTANHVSCDVVGSCTVANLVVARDVNFGRRVNLNVLVSSLSGNADAVVTRRSSGEVVDTRVIKVQIDRGQILSGNLNTVKIPNPSCGSSTTCGSCSVLCNTALAHVLARGVVQRHGNCRFSLINHSK